MIRGQTDGAKLNRNGRCVEKESYNLPLIWWTRELRLFLILDGLLETMNLPMPLSRTEAMTLWYIFIIPWRPSYFLFMHMLFIDFVEFLSTQLAKHVNLGYMCLDLLIVVTFYKPVFIILFFFLLFCWYCWTAKIWRWSRKY